MMTFNATALTKVFANGNLMDRVYINGVRTHHKFGSALIYHYQATEWIVPAGVYNISVCMIGGGGSGDAGDRNGHRYGGSAGSIVEFTASVTPGQVLSLTIGDAHLGWYWDNENPEREGVNGEATIFLGHSAAGGAGGNYAGNDGSRNTCQGTKTDGTRKGTSSGYAYGGQAGLDNGGDGSDINNGSAGGGNYGAGGGGAMCTDSYEYVCYSGWGGVGAIFIVWGE